MKAKAASNKNAAKVTAKKAVNLEYIPDYDELKEMSLNEFAGKGETLNLATLMSKPKYFDSINDILNTTIKAAGIEIGYAKNFAKLYCIYSMTYPLKCYCRDDIIQKTITKDLLEMNEKGEELSEMLRHFSGFNDLIDPDETDMLNVTDEQFKEFMTA